jgi:hypothetical protein
MCNADEDKMRHAGLLGRGERLLEGNEIDSAKLSGLPGRWMSNADQMNKGAPRGTRSA